MSFDATVERLTGAHIRKVIRRGSCLELDTDKGRVIVGSHKEWHETVCFGCGEERLVFISETFGKRQASCDVCGHFWDLEPKAG